MLRDKPSGSSEEGEDIGNGSKAQAMDAIEYTSKTKVEDIEDLNPVQDFEVMMSRRDDPEWVSKAIQFMKSKVFVLVENFSERDNSQKALECLSALRKGCILEQVFSLSPPSTFFVCTLYKSKVFRWYNSKQILSLFPTII